MYKVDSPEELLAVYDAVAPSTDVLLAQEWIVGGEGEHFTCNCYFDRRSTPVATFVTRKIRQWPPQTGQGRSPWNAGTTSFSRRLFDSSPEQASGVSRISR